jgi:hypothetical protein
MLVPESYFLIAARSQVRIDNSNQNSVLGVVGKFKHDFFPVFL